MKNVTKTDLRGANCGFRDANVSRATPLRVRRAHLRPSQHIGFGHRCIATDCGFDANVVGFDYRCSCKDCQEIRARYE
jgi:hypothetical protein